MLPTKSFARYLLKYSYVPFFAGSLLLATNPGTNASEVSPPPAAVQKSPEDQLTLKLAQLIRQSEIEIGDAKFEMAMSTLNQAKQLAVQAERPESGLIEARIIRLKNAMNKTAPVAEAAPAAEPTAAREVMPPIPEAPKLEPVAVAVAKAPELPTPAESEKPAPLQDTASPAPVEATGDGPLKDTTPPAPTPPVAPTADNKTQKPSSEAPDISFVNARASTSRAIELSPVECLEIAIQNNLALRISRLSDRSTDLTLDQAWAKYYPELSGGYTASGGKTNEENSFKNDITTQVTQNTPIGTKLTFQTHLAETYPTRLPSENRDLGYSLALTQPLWKGAGLNVGMHEIRVARLNKLISRAALELDVQTLIFTVKKDYANCVQQLQSLEVNKSAVKSAKEFLRLTGAREHAGQVTRLDVFNAEVQLADRELALISNQRVLQSSLDQLKQDMDVDLEENLAVTDQPIDFGDKPGPADQSKVIVPDYDAGTVMLVTRQKYKVTVQVPFHFLSYDLTFDQIRDAERDIGTPALIFKATRHDFQSMLDTALASRVELLNSRRSIAIKKLDTLLSRNGLGTQLDLAAKYGRSKSGNNWSTARGFEDDGYSIGLNFSVPWGKISDRAEYEKSLLELQKSEIELKRSRTTIHSQVRDIWRNLLETERSVLIQGKKVEQAKKSVEAAQISFDRGLKDSFDVITARNNLLQAQNDFISRTQDYTVLQAQVDSVVGTNTGRVDLSARTSGGQIKTGVSEVVPGEKKPASAPTVGPDESDVPYPGYREREYKSKPQKDKQ